MKIVNSEGEAQTSGLRALRMERRVSPVLVGCRLAPGALLAVAPQGYLRPNDDQCEPGDGCEGERLAEEEHAVEEREDGVM